MPVWKKALAVMLSLVVALGLLLFVAGLANKINPIPSPGPSNSSSAASAAPEVGLSGYAFLATPLTGATVNVYELKSDGQAGVLLASTTTDASGYYTVSAAIGLPSSSSLLVTTAGGSSVDEISGKPTQSAPGDSLKTIVAPGAAYALLTPLTTLAASRTVSLIAAGNSADNSIAVSYGAIARQYNLETLTAILPAVVNDPQSVKVSGATARQMGLILAGLDEEAATLGVTDFGLVNALAQDISDGTFDGKEGAAPITIGDPILLPPDAATLKLAEAISKINANHLPIQLLTQQPAISNLGPGVLFVSSPGLPAFVDGEAATALIGYGGGTPEITCELKSGSIMPAEFSLLPNCGVQYSGVPVLGTSVGRIGAEFTVVMSDSSKPKQAVSFDLRISVGEKPPAISTKDGICHGRQAGLFAVKQPCNLTIATASGGTKPYSFTGEFEFGGPPLGMFIGTHGVDGTLSGSPLIAGPYTFNVCVVDLVGYEKCAPVTVVVEDTSSSPSDTPTPSDTSPASPNVGAGTVVGTWVSGPIDFTRKVGGCSVETDRYSGSTWVISDQANGFAPLAANQVGISVTLDGGEIVSQSDPGCLNFIVYLNNPLSVYQGTVNGSTMALADADNPPVPQGSCTIGVSTITCTIDDGQHSEFDYATAPGGIQLTKQK
jgi:hypothetical protein